MLFISFINTLLKKWVKAVAKAPLAESLVMLEYQSTQMNSHVNRTCDVPKHSPSTCTICPQESYS